MNVMGLKYFKKMIYLHYIVFQLMIISFLNYITLVLRIIRAEATLIYKAVIVRNLINQAAPMIIRNIETM